MAENSGEKGLGKIFSKKMSRTKERVQQKIGRADRTTDGAFDRLVDSFSEQQAVANHLQKEFKAYTAQVKAMSLASQSMYQAIRDSYESSWKNADKFVPAIEQLVNLWDDYLMKLNDNVQTPLTNYANKFRDVKTKIAKRGRKLTDFDSARHNTASLENAKRRDEAKISKAQEDMNTAKVIYDAINNELCEELPNLYLSRVPTLCGYFGTLFEAETLFQMECAKIKKELTELVEDEIGSDMEAPSPSRSQASAVHSSVPARPPVLQRDESRHMPREDDDGLHDYITLITEAERVNSESSESDAEESDRNSEKPPSRSVNVDSPAKGGSLSSGGAKAASDRELNITINAKLSSSSNSSLDSGPKALQHFDQQIPGPLVSSQTSLKVKDDGTKIEVQPLNDPGLQHTENGKGSVKGGESQRSSRSSSSSNEEPTTTTPTTDKSHDYLYQVTAIHSYEADDADELSFEKGDVINVLPFEQSEEQDEGWLLGVNCSTGEKGVFPMNFTNRM